MSDTTKLSSFPDRVDTFERVSDLSVQEGTFEKSKIYKGYIDSENYSQAEQYLKDNEDLARCAVNAGMFNKHSDALTALETEFMLLSTKGTSSAYTITCDWCNEYILNRKYIIKFHTHCSANATININNLGAVPIKYNNTNIKAGMINANNIFIVQYQYYNSSYSFNIIGQTIGGLEVPNVNDPTTWLTITGTSGKSVGFDGAGGAKVRRTSSGNIEIKAPLDTSPTANEKEIGTFCGEKMYQKVYKINHIPYSNTYSLDISDISATSIIDISGIIKTKKDGVPEFTNSMRCYPISPRIYGNESNTQLYIDFNGLAYPSFSITVIVKYIKS
ncbi:MAG: hypothetical protein HFH14_01605 [Lachnospiraceae bacterium]|nr:hypothetical protein [Lachnospiraceae bacterium]